MFNNIIYFIIVLLIFNISYPDSTPDSSLGYSLVMFFLCGILFAGYCRWGFRRLLISFSGVSNSRLTNEYHGLVLRLSILAIFLFSLDVYIFHSMGPISRRQNRETFLGLTGHSSYRALYRLSCYNLVLCLSDLPGSLSGKACKALFYHFQY